MTSTDMAKATIRPGERRELKALVKLKIKALRAEIEDTQAAQLADIDRRIAEKFRGDAVRLSDLKTSLRLATEQANADIDRLFAEYSDMAEKNHRGTFSVPYFQAREDGKHELRRALVAAVHAQATAARQRLVRLEVELLESLALDSLQTDAAKDFVARMPTVDALMPQSRMAEVEAGFAGGE